MSAAAAYGIWCPIHQTYGPCEFCAAQQNEIAGALERQAVDLARRFNQQRDHEDRLLEELQAEVARLRAERDTAGSYVGSLMAMRDLRTTIHEACGLLRRVIAPVLPSSAGDARIAEDEDAVLAFLSHHDPEGA